MRFLAVLAITLLAGFVGYSVATATKVAIPAADGGDWLNAAATAAGVMLTVAAAVGIEYYSRNWRTRADRARLREALAEFNSAAKWAARIPRWQAKPPVQGESLVVQRRMLKAIGKYRFVRGQIAVTDLALWDALEELDAAVARDEAMLARELILLRDGGETEQIYSINRDTVSNAATRLALYVAQAMDAARKAGRRSRDPIPAPPEEVNIGSHGHPYR